MSREMVARERGARWLANRPSSGLRAALLVPLLVLLPGSRAAGAAPGSGLALVPHHAVYELSRGPGSSDTAIGAVTGRLELTYEASCDGWRIEQSLGLRLFSAGALAADSLAVLTAWETRDGQDYWFNSHAYEGGRLEEVIRGVAQARHPGGPIDLRLGAPYALKRELPPGTVFQAAHLEALLAAAQTGERALRRVVFDGSTLDSPYEVSAFFGAERAPDPRLAAEADRAWPMRLAYYRSGALDPAPEFELSVLLHEGGISGDMIYDYGALKIAVDLREFERLDDPGECP